MDSNSPDADHLFSHRYLQGRLPTAAPNPRGKHHRKPLPWKHAKILTVEGWADDAYEYRKHLWKEQTQQTQQNQKQPRPSKPHFLTLLDAHARRNRVLRYYCSCCYDLTNVEPLRRWRREWPALRVEGEVLAAEGVLLPGEYTGGVIQGWDTDGDPASEGQMAEDPDGLLRGPGFELGDIQRGEQVFTVRYSARRKGKHPLMKSVDEKVGRGPASMSDDFKEARWEWEFLGTQSGARGLGDDESVESSEWLAVETDVDSLDSEEEDWEMFRY